MYHYHAFGECLASALPFPELHLAPAAAPRWTFCVNAPEAIPEPRGQPLGAQPIYGDCHARLYRDGEDLIITVDDTGRYLVRDGGRQIDFWPVPHGTQDYARAHLLGRVLATALHFNGALVLHGSAVAYPGGVVAFLAPKHSGKSTLALTLTMAGARLVSDDTIALVLPDQGPPQVRPGIHSLRLFPDSAVRLLGHEPGQERQDGKQLVAGLRPDQRQDSIAPLAAIYLLVPAESLKDGGAVGRRPVPQPIAAAAMVGQGKITEMLGTAEAPVLLRRAAGLVTRVPVFQLGIQHDLTRLPEVARQLGEWHGMPTGVP